ncbi:hypothetical protein [Mucilaginibacter myungsuensis]|uniref:Pentapeptide MXKDX repeat protein n=1 Tax=Mucilaginibacter myungsuensis TaxID=649104 RepID=A0A929L1Q1_9SPHI|nr:hypothetical protein [Mucilaginibacter myungsuensis]MBE9662879.1 hypothetical protein [Mucilaginibacter myungsuensis]MDN3598299.1 hypothetical protein [Mucilaginibacter myungsuensis]
MKKLIAMFALAAISFGSVYAQTQDTTKKKQDTTKKEKQDTSKKTPPTFKFKK